MASTGSYIENPHDEFYFVADLRETLDDEGLGIRPRLFPDSWHSPPSIVNKVEERTIHGIKIGDYSLVNGVTALVTGTHRARSSFPEIVSHLSSNGAMRIFCPVARIRVGKNEISADISEVEQTSPRRHDEKYILSNVFALVAAKMALDYRVLELSEPDDARSPEQRLSELVNDDPETAAIYLVGSIVESYSSRSLSKRGPEIALLERMRLSVDPAHVAVHSGLREFWIDTMDSQRGGYERYLLDSLRFLAIFSHWHFEDPLPEDFQGRMYKRMVDSDDRRKFLHYLDTLLLSIGMSADVGRLRLSENGDNQHLTVLSSDEMCKDIVVPIPLDPHGIDRVASVISIDAAGKDLLLSGTFYPVLHLSQPGDVRFRRLATYYGREEIGMMFEELGYRISELFRSREYDVDAINEIQEKLRKVRVLLGTLCVEDGKFKEIDSLVEFLVLNRSFTAGPAYATSTSHFAMNLAAEFIDGSIIPARNFHLRTPLAVCLARLNERGTKDVVEEGGIETLFNAAYRYDLMGILFPKLIKVISPMTSFGSRIAVVRIDHLVNELGSEMDEYLGLTR